ncbi:MAG: alpha-ketoacid dehydrogenase subunit beta [Planctomycetia bacterium]|nr:alpha-ketoacid dehydrogenase subunit beta [Planctomycetia bacterium]
MKPRTLRYCQAIHEALDLSLARDPSVYVMGLGVPDPKGVFETTLGLAEKFGSQRVLDMPASENGMTGIAIGSALAGMRPVLVHQRLDFAILAMDQMVNQAAKWCYMFGGQQGVPLVVRMIVGRGWGQGSQHAQSLQSWFAHVPGLKVIMPATPHDAKGLLIAAIEDNNPVISIEHRWLFNIEGPVPEGHYREPIGQARVIRPGRDLTIVAVSHMTIESLRAAEVLAEQGIEAEVVDLRTVRPLDRATILQSIAKTSRLVAVDTGWPSCGVSAEIVALAAEGAWSALKAPPVRVTLADCSSPSTPALARRFFPRVHDIVNAGRRVVGLEPLTERAPAAGDPPADVPDNDFRGPF